ncbi:WD40 repeat domain-containing protein [Cystobacter fuscus]
MDELPEDLLVAASQGEQSLEVEKVRHQLGSGSLLVRDEEGRFSFVHQSVMEWLVAEMAAEQVRSRGESPALGQREMSDLMADFFIALAGREATRVWAEAKSASGEGDMAKRNALHVLSRLRQEDERRGRVAELESVKNLERNDLRGRDLSKADLHHANLRRADLSGVPLVEANLEKAQLQEACLTRAILDRAKLAGADLTGADLMGASLMGADLRGVRLNGTSLRRTRLLGALVDSFEGSDVFGAALPVQGQPVPQFAMESACLVTAFSPRDGLLATGHEDGTLLVWSAVVGKPLRVLQGHSAEVLDVVFSPDGALLASASVDGTVRLWSLEEARCLHKMKGHAGSVLGLAFSPDGSLLASAAEDERVRLWSVSDGQFSRVLNGRVEDVLELAFNTEGTFLSTVSSGGQVSRWSVSNGDRLDTFQLPPEGSLRAAAFSLDREWLAFSISDDDKIRLWSMASGRLVHALVGHKGAVGDLAFSPDGTTLASASSEGTIRIWGVSDGSDLHVLNEADAFNCVRFSPDGTSIASGSEYGPARLWSVTEGRSLRVLEQRAAYPALGVAFNPDGTTLVCASDNGSLAFWDATGGRLLRTLELDAGSVGRVVFSLEGSRVATCNRKASLVKVWNMSDKRSYRVSHPAAVTSLSFSPDGGTLVLASNDGVVSIWSVETQRARVEAGAPERGGILGTTFSPDGTLLALACRDRVIRLWRMPEFTPGPILEGHGKPVRCVAFSPNGRILASASSDRSICLWSIPDGKLQKHLPVGPESPGDVTELVFDPSGMFIVSLCSMGTALLWSVEEGRILRVLNEEHRLIQGISFSQDGRTLVAAHEDGAVDFYNVETGERLGQLLWFSEGWLALRSDGRYRSGGETAGAFWYAQGLCRFEPQELSPYLTTPLLLDSTESFLAPAPGASPGTTAGHRQTGTPRESR